MGKNLENILGEVVNASESRKKVEFATPEEEAIFDEVCALLDKFDEKAASLADAHERGLSSAQWLAKQLETSIPLDEANQESLVEAVKQKFNQDEGKEASHE